MSDPLAGWQELMVACGPWMTCPSFALFQELVIAWVLCPGRRTFTRIIRVLGPRPRRAHDAYHRFPRAPGWRMDRLWWILARHLVATLALESTLETDLDDTLFHKTGRKVDGAGVFRDAIRSTGRKLVYALGLNLVVLTLRIRAPWGKMPLGLPIDVRLYRKGGPTHLDLAEEMIREVAQWFPDHRIELAADGAYASLAARDLPRTDLTSRMRRDAALYRPAPARSASKRRGRPPKKGKRLPSPEQMARFCRHWERQTVEIRGRTETRLLHAQRVLWYGVCRGRELLLVIVRDPSGKQHDDFFFTTHLDVRPCEVAARYHGRWSIEETFRNVKQYLGGEHPQTWKGTGPERAACLAFWIYSAVWSWYLGSQGSRPTFPVRPWYPSKSTPSFLDALAALRRILWPRQISAGSRPALLKSEIHDTIIDVLAEAA